MMRPPMPAERPRGPVAARLWARWLGLLALSLLLWLPAQAQSRLTTPPGAANKQLGQQMQSADLAVSSWSRSDLHEWWAALRSMDGSPGSMPAHLQPPSDPSRWSRVQLPDVRGRDVGKPFVEDPQYQMRWYRFRYAPAQGGWPTSVALYMPRLVTMAAAVLVHTDEGWRPVFDNQAGAREQWVRPLWVVFPAALTALHQDQSLEVVLAVPAINGTFYSVSKAWLGPREELEALYQRRWALQIGVPQATGLTLVVLGLFSFTLWLRRRNESAFLLFALASVAWLLRNLHYHVDLPRTRAGLEWFWWGTHASMSWVMWLTFLFVLRFSRRSSPRFEFAVAALVLSGSFLTLPFWRPMFDGLYFQQLVNMLLGVACTSFVVVVALRERRYGLRMIALSLVLSLLLGIHDLLLLAGWAWPEHVYLMPFATLIVVASFLYALQNRYVGASYEVEMLNENLAQRLDAQSREMQAQHDRLREAERQQALLLERQRLMQDMHDGLGSSLLSAMVAVEQGSMDQDRVVEVLRECVDDLRLVIDSLEPIGHDLVSLLATMRYRLGKRLQAGGLTLEWDVQDLPPLEWLEPPDALHVLRLMQEALSNVLKHARASRVRMVTRHHGSYVEIRVEDDGEGFDINTAQRGRGLKSQQRRSQRLGGSLRIDSSPGAGTRLSLRLPVTRPEAPGQQSPA
ncbi:signal transduction histidine kinase [Paucibacter oligotrophus]|uniref:histidine kinase n=1 Tax=Roseateles oligotrophus TaxID=1769250 RepID=A0A840LJ06_9BURK|nr:sensor histidine kinase [Roseateles oligotrophus]MBB4845257.1 signal transduction histidine kinase [Roseateles oligotrophus]